MESTIAHPPKSRYRCEAEWLAIQIAFGVPGAKEALEKLHEAHKAGKI